MKHATKSLGLTLSLALAWTLGCSTTSQVLTVQEERALGGRARQEFQRQHTLMRDRVVVTYVRRLGEALYEKSAPSPFEPRFAVVESEDLNAFATFGGSIYVHSGLILAAKDESELAGVIAHEIGHATARHLAKIYPVVERTNFLARMLLLAVDIASGRPQARRSSGFLLGLGSAMYLTKFGRDDEREADALAVETLVNAGYDPEAMIRFFETLKEKGGGGGLPQFLLSHPATDERIENVRALIAQTGPPANPITPDHERFRLIQSRIRNITGLDQSLDEDALEEDGDLDEGDDD